MPFGDSHTWCASECVTIFDPIPDLLQIVGGACGLLMHLAGPELADRSHNVPR
jgi:hypothetical protein